MKKFVCPRSKGTCSAIVQAKASWMGGKSLTLASKSTARASKLAKFPVNRIGMFWESQSNFKDKPACQGKTLTDAPVSKVPGIWMVCLSEVKIRGNKGEKPASPNALATGENGRRSASFIFCYRSIISSKQQQRHVLRAATKRDRRGWASTAHFPVGKAPTLKTG